MCTTIYEEIAVFSAAFIMLSVLFYVNIFLFVHFGRHCTAMNRRDIHTYTQRWIAVCKLLMRGSSFSDDRHFAFIFYLAVNCVEFLGFVT